jgi:hypothetical protein
VLEQAALSLSARSLFGSNKFFYANVEYSFFSAVKYVYCTLNLFSLFISSFLYSVSIRFCSPFQLMYYALGASNFLKASSFKQPSINSSRETKLSALVSIFLKISSTRFSLESSSSDIFGFLVEPSNS